MSNEFVNRNSLIVIVLIMTLACSSAILATSTFANAQTQNLDTHAFITLSPDPAGINQEVTLSMWLIEFPPTSGGGATAPKWQNFEVLVTKPDGTTQTLGPYTANAASFAVTIFYPDQLGEYTFDFSFPGQQIDTYNYGPSSASTTLTVQEQKVEPLPQVPLPTEYWQRPINAQNQEWYTISGNWFGLGGGSFGCRTYDVTGNFNPYSAAPQSAHIVWAKPFEYGGLIGGEFGGTAVSNYYTGRDYEPAFVPPVIINGVLFYNEPANPREGFYAVDIRTGETLWWHNTTANYVVSNNGPSYPDITNGQVFNYMSPNQIGGIPYLWWMSGTTWYMYDAHTGNLILTIGNATTGTTVEGPNGELLVYILRNGWLAMWNSTQCIGTAGATGTNSWQWRPQPGSTLDWQGGVQWNVTAAAYAGQSINSINCGIILATTGSMLNPQNWQWEIGYNSTTGAQIWSQNRTTPYGETPYNLMGPLQDGVYSEYHRDSMEWYGFSAYTGEQIWGPTTPYGNAWGSEPADNSVGAYGIIVGGSADGIHAINATSGERMWDFYADDSGVNFPGFSTYPFEGGGGTKITVADGTVFVATGDSHGDPLFRGCELYAINIYTGQEKWSINSMTRDTMPIADGYLLAVNMYDMQLYSFGKGQSGTSVTATPGVGNAVTIQGMVTDQSPGQTCLGIPAAGTPAVSDQSMSAWMEYLYMQQIKPTDTTGVPVQLSVTDSNGNTQPIGTVTSDAAGHFALSWTPPSQGMYKITATFAGSNSYYSSEAETHIAVGSSSAAPIVTSSPAPIVTPPPASNPPAAAFSASTTLYIAITVVVLVAVIAVAVALRRRK